MTNLISLENVCLAYGLDSLLNNSKLQIEKGERVCLIGRNGAGKSSLLKIIEGSLLPDSGSVWRKPHLRMARLAQELPLDRDVTVYEFVSEGLEEAGKFLAEYHAITHKLTQHYDENDLIKLEKVQRKIDACNGWEFEQNIKTILTRLELNPDNKLNELSGGWQRRVALAKALVSSPELLLLDEPTNHLDIQAIQWLEDQLMSLGCGLIFITHDRALLQRLATRIIELDRGNLTSWPGDYENFLRRKEELLNAEAVQNALFDKKLAQEEVWIRQGIKARRTRNEGRVRALEALRVTRSKRREVQGKADFELNAADKSGKLVVEAKHISKYFADETVIKNFSLRIMRGDKIGLIGPNGVGKSTLLNMLLDKLQPDEGEIIQGTKLQIAYFDQQRQVLDPEKSIIDNVVEGSEFIEINEQKKHIMSYLMDFLFTPQRARTPVKALSGGECNRLLLAKLFSKPANLIIMDEPTNDLDIETLELLEDLLSNYQGTLLLVSHDRAFLDNVVTSTLVFEGGGKIQEYIGGYQDWLRQSVVQRLDRGNQNKTDNKSEIKNSNKEFSSNQNKDKNVNQNKNKKLNFKEQRELEELPNVIEEMEKQQLEFQEKISQKEFYLQDKEAIADVLNKISQLEKDLKQKYLRWEELLSRVD